MPLNPNIPTRVSVRIDALLLDKPLLLSINDGLMAVFFFLDGLEIKSELADGALSTRERALLPASRCSAASGSP